MRSHSANVTLLAKAVADGSRIDWDQAEASASSPEERDLVQQLRALAAVGEVSRAQAAMWGPLRIRDEIGSGTFGTIYRAWDPKLDREVALKLLKSAHTATPLATEVIKEGRLLGQIRHPNVVTVYGADAFDGQVGVWMEYIRGRTLKQVVEEHGPLAAHEAAGLGLELCRALAAVHQRGFVHGDIKAQNVMREDGGRTVLMDFGAGDVISRSKTAAKSPDGLTGTPAYLAPEVLRGATHTVASDIYSLGVLLYFLVSGHFPVVGSSLTDIREKHDTGQRTPLRDVRPDLPPAFVRVVDRATAADPAERPASAGALEQLLESALTSTRRPVKPVFLIATATMAGAVIVASAWMLRWRETPPPQSPVVARNSVVVLPFKNLTDDPNNDYFSEGITADIVAKLATLQDLRIISNASVNRSRSQGHSPLQIGAELGVAAVLEGSVRTSGDRVRIVTQLTAVPSGEQLWSDSFDREIADIFRIQSEVARKIAIALRGELSQSDAERFGQIRPVDLETSTLYLKGRHYWSLRTEDGFRRSLQYFEQALQRDPSYAPAHAGIADVYTLMGVYGMLPRAAAVSRATASARRAIELDPTLAEAHASLGYIQKNQFDWAAAEASFQRALTLRPGYAPAHHWYAILLTQQGRFAEAITEIKVAISLDPLSIGPCAQFASTLLMARRYDEAIAQAQKILQMDKDFSRAHQTIAEAYAYTNRHDHALAALDQAVRLVPLGGDNQDLQADFGYIYAKSGRHADAQRIAAALIDRFRREPQPVAGAIASIYAALGQLDHAFHWLDVARERNDLEIGYLKVDPRWDPLRRDPRFHAYLASAGFESR